MDREREGLYVGWLGTAMTTATAAAGIAALLLPRYQPLLWALLVMFAAGTVLCFLRVWVLHRQREADKLPKVGKGLELREESSALRTPDTAFDKRTDQALNLKPDPDHLLHATVAVTAPLDPPLLEIECTDSIFGAFGIYRCPGEEPIMCREIVEHRQERIVMRLGRKTLPVGTEILLTINAATQIKLRKVEPKVIPL